MNEEQIKKIVSEIDFEPIKNIGNGIYLNSKQMEVLDRYEIDYKNCVNIHELIYKIEDLLNEEYNGIDMEDLDWVSQSLSEFNYYHNTNK